MAETQATNIVAEPLSRGEIPLLDPATTEVSSTLELSIPKSDQIIGDRTPLPFEEVPGPTVLKIWEKYWKYVPLLGTQLFSSLLINRFTQGTIC